MKVGIPKEIKNNENRVGMTPSGVAELVRRGHTVYVQHTAGEGSGFNDKDYEAVGAQMLLTIEDVYREADMIVKVKEPIEPEYPLVRKGQVVFTYFHFACEEELTHAMLTSGPTCIAYETYHPTTHSDPVYTVDGIVHYAVANIPGAVPNTSTIALTNATLRYVLALADKGWQQACRDNRSLARGVNMIDGRCTYEAVAKVWNLQYTPLAL